MQEGQEQTAYSSLNYSVSSANSMDSNDADFEGGQSQKPSHRPGDLISHRQSSPEPNILQVYAAYDTGQGAGVKVGVGGGRRSTTQ